MILDEIATEFGRGLRFIDWGGGNYKTKDPDFVFNVPFLRLQAGAVMSLKTSVLFAPSLKEIQLVLFELRLQVCLHPRWPPGRHFE